MSARLRWILVAGVLAAACGTIAWLRLRGNEPTGAGPIVARPELPHRVTVEVLNTTAVGGIARLATVELRHAGLDVVAFGNSEPSLAGTVHNQVLVRRGDTTGVGRVVEALGGATITEAPDRTRMADLTVVIGSEFVQPRPAPRR